MRLLGLVKHGLYVSESDDEYADIDPKLLNHHYGTTHHNPKHRSHRTGAGHPSDEDSSSNSEGDSEPDSMRVDRDDSDNESDAASRNSASERSDLDEPNTDHSDLEAHIAVFVDHQVHGKEIVTPRHENPFDSDADMETFNRALQSVQSEGIVPDGYGILPEEWEEDGYPTYEILKVGRRGKKELRVALPHEVWRPRAELWIQALVVMTGILELTIE